MQGKQTLRVEEQDLESIIKIRSSVTSFVDQSYWEGVMEETKDVKNKEAKNHPVEIECMRSDWIMDKDGKRFFTAILQSE